MRINIIVLMPVEKNGEKFAKRLFAYEDCFVPRVGEILLHKTKPYTVVQVIDVTEACVLLEVKEHAEPIITNLPII